MADARGGDKVGEKLRAIADQLGEPEVRMGFLAGSTYPDGTPTPMVATVMEFGTTIAQPAREQSVFRNVDLATGEFRQGGRFVKRRKANLETRHAVAAHTVTIPPRPYFRTMITENQGGWSALVVKMLTQTKGDGSRALALMGLELKAQLQESILKLVSPPLARSTVRRKGFDKPLIDTSHLLNSVDYEVTEK